MANWNAIENDPSYQAMPPKDKERTKRLYLNQVITKDPSYQAMSDGDKKKVIAGFLGIPNPQPEHDYGWDALPAAYHHAGESAKDLGLAVLKTGTQLPAEAVKAVAGLPQKAGLKMIQEGTNLPRKVIDAPFDYVTKHYADPTKGSYPQQFVNSLANRPFQTAADVATVATLPGVSNAVGAAAGAAASRLPSSVVGAAKVAKAIAVPTQTINNLADKVANRMIPTVARYGNEVTHPTNSLMGRVLEGRGQEVFDLMEPGKGYKVHVPGFTPTTAQILSTMDDAPTKLAGIVREAEKHASTRSTSAKAAQNKALLSHIDEVAQLTKHPTMTADELAKLSLPERMEVTKKLHKDTNYYEKSDAIQSKANKRLLKIVNLPTSVGGKNALTHAEDIAKASEKRFGKGKNVPAIPEQRIPDPYGQWAVPDTVIPAQKAKYATYTGEELHSLIKSMDDVIEKMKGNANSMTSAGKEELAAAISARTKLVNWVKAKNSEFEKAQAEFGQMAQLIDRQKWANYMRSKLTNKPSGDDTLKLMSQQYRNAMDSPLNENTGGSVRRVTGMQRHPNAKSLMGPEYKNFENVAEELARMAQGEELGVAGVSSGGELHRAMSDALHLAPDGFITQAAHLSPKWIDRRIANKVAEKIQTPEGARELIKNYLNREAKVAKIKGRYNALLKANRLNPIRVMNKYPALYNMIPPQQEPRN